MASEVAGHNPARNMSNTKLAYTIAEAVALLPWGRTKTWELVRNKVLPTQKKFGRVYVLHEDLVNLLRPQNPEAA